MFSLNINLNENNQLKLLKNRYFHLIFS